MIFTDFDFSQMIKIFFLFGEKFFISLPLHMPLHMPLHIPLAENFNNILTRSNLFNSKDF